MARIERFAEISHYELCFWAMSASCFLDDTLDYRDVVTRSPIPPEAILRIIKDNQRLDTPLQNRAEKFATDRVDRKKAVLINVSFPSAFVYRQSFVCFPLFGEIGTREDLIEEP
ncbi:MAG: hypothetical protein AMXMBFR44_6900 [Candidatus Campbellbacteria bacterium]